jgi:hypothetical protein
MMLLLASRRGIGIAACAAILCAGSALPAIAHTVPFFLEGARYIVIEVTVGESVRARFAVDSASSITVISPRLADRLGLESHGDRQTLTQTGAERVPFTRVPTIRLGGLTARDVRVLVTPLGTFSALGCNVEGVIGQDVMEGWNYLIDYRRQVIEFDRVGRAARTFGGHALPFAHVGRRAVVDARALLAVGMEPVPIRLALDSAASTLMFFERSVSAAPPLKLYGRTENVRLLSLHGTQLARRGRIERLVVGGKVLLRTPATLTRRPEGWMDHGQDGLLPTALFDAVYFDNDEHVVVLNPTRVDPVVDTEDDDHGGCRGCAHTPTARPLP